MRGKMRAVLKGVDMWLGFIIIGVVIGIVLTVALEAFVLWYFSRGRPPGNPKL